MAAFVWTGAGADVNWSTPANWVGGVAPPAAELSNGVADQFTFDTATAGFSGSATSFTPNNDVGPATNVNALTINDASAAGNFTLSSSVAANVITLNVATVTIAASDGNAVTISAPIGVTGLNSYTVTNAADTVSQTGIVSGAGTLDKLGSGRLTLNQANTFTGTMRATAGFLRGTSSVGAF